MRGFTTSSNKLVKITSFGASAKTELTQLGMIKGNIGQILKTLKGMIGDFSAVPAAPAVEEEEPVIAPVAEVEEIEETVEEPIIEETPVEEAAIEETIEETVEEAPVDEAVVEEPVEEEQAEEEPEAESEEIEESAEEETEEAVEEPTVEETVEEKPFVAPAKAENKAEVKEPDQKPKKKNKTVKILIPIIAAVVAFVMLCTLIGAIIVGAVLLFNNNGDNGRPQESSQSQSQSSQKPNSSSQKPNSSSQSSSQKPNSSSQSSSQNQAVPGTEVVYGKFILAENSKGKYIVTNYTGNESLLEIPASVNGKAVVGIGSNAFKNKTFAIVLIPSSVTEISANAFVNTDISELKIEGNTTIRERAFNGGTLETVLAYGNVIVETDAFHTSAAIEELDFFGENIQLAQNIVNYSPMCLQISGKYLDGASVSLKNTVIIGIVYGPVEQITATNSLQTVIIGAEVTRIEKEAFANCYLLEEAYFESPYNWSYSFYGNLFSVSDLDDEVTAAEHLTGTYVDCELIQE